MKIQSIKIRHSYHFSDLKIEFKYAKKPITLILGDQSTGKTAIIKNIYQALTWFPARFKDLRTAGVVMLDSDIMQNCVQSRIEINTTIPPEIGSLSESTNAQEKETNTCTWTLHKTISANGLGLSKVDTTQLEQVVNIYNKAIAQDPLQGLPIIAYYPTDRFVNEMNLLSKNNPSVFQSHSAYEIAPLPYTTFARFFEWFREINDIENAQTAHLFQQILDIEHKDIQINQLEDQPQSTNIQNYELNQSLDAETTSLTKKLFQAHAQMHAPSIAALKTALETIFPELTDIYLEYLPKLQLMVTYQDQTLPYAQLSNSMRNWIALVGDVVRRMCLLNPNQLYPCMEGEGILMIDNIDAQLDQNMTQNILNRLHHAFPNLQIIATGTSEDLLEHAQDYQYFKLEHTVLHEIDLSIHEMILEKIYQDLLQHVEPTENERSLDAEIHMMNAQNVFENFQLLSSDQQTAFLQMIQGDDQVSAEKI